MNHKPTAAELPGICSDGTGVIVPFSEAAGEAAGGLVGDGGSRGELAGSRVGINVDAGGEVVESVELTTIDASADALADAAADAAADAGGVSVNGRVTVGVGGGRAVGGTASV